MLTLRLSPGPPAQPSHLSRAAATGRFVIAMFTVAMAFVIASVHAGTDARRGQETIDHLAACQCRMAQACWAGRLDEPIYAHLYALRAAAHRATLRATYHPDNPQAAAASSTAVEAFNRDYTALMPREDKDLGQRPGAVPR